MKIEQLNERLTNVTNNNDLYLANCPICDKGLNQHSLSYRILKSKGVIELKCSRLNDEGVFVDGCNNDDIIKALGITLEDLIVVPDVTPALAPVAPAPAPAIEAYYDIGKKEYLLKNKRGAWLNLNESQFKSELRERGFNDKEVNGQQSEIKKTLIRLRNEKDVVYAGKIAGYMA